MVLQSLTHSTTTLKLLNDQRKSGNFTDFTISVSEESFCVHRWLFAAHSALFKRTLETSDLKQVWIELSCEQYSDWLLAIIQHAC